MGALHDREPEPEPVSASGKAGLGPLGISGTATVTNPEPPEQPSVIFQPGGEVRAKSRLRRLWENIIHGTSAQ